MSLQIGSVVISPITTNYLTKGKECRLENVGDKTSFRTIADSGRNIFCLLEGCAHLNGGNWEIKQIKK